MEEQQQQNTKHNNCHAESETNKPEIEEHRVHTEGNHTRARTHTTHTRHTQDREKKEAEQDGKGVRVRDRERAEDVHVDRTSEDVTREEKKRFAVATLVACNGDGGDGIAEVAVRLRAGRGKGGR